MPTARRQRSPKFYQPEFFRRIWKQLSTPYRERHVRSRLKLPRIVHATALPSISRFGHFDASAESARLNDCFEKANSNASRLSEKVRDIEGMSGQKYRSFINYFVQASPDARYLEIGCWKGSTAVAALFDNQVKALFIDNWSLFGGPRSTFVANVESVLSERIDFSLIDSDFRSVDYRSLGPFNIYFFDGPHGEVDQRDGIVLARPALAERFLLVVDDWNWSRVRIGAFKGLLDADLRIESSIEIRTTLDNSHGSPSGKYSNWHNGYFFAVIGKE